MDIKMVNMMVNILLEIHKKLFVNINCNDHLLNIQWLLFLSGLQGKNIPMQLHLNFRRLAVSLIQSDSQWSQQ